MIPNSRENPRRPDLACFRADLLWAARRTRAVFYTEFRRLPGPAGALPGEPAAPMEATGQEFCLRQRRDLLEDML
jgi:hypothetical protein